MTRSITEETAFETASGIPVARYYSAADLPSSTPQEAPGEFPYSRGIQPAGYRSKLWTMRQYAGFGSARETNARFRYLLSQGQTGLSLAFDLPTQLGLDSDSPRAAGEVGRVGVAIDSLADMEAVFDGIPTGEVSTSMTINAPAAILLAMYVVAAEKRGTPRAQLAGTTQNDVLKEYIARGTYIFPPRESLRLCTDIIEFCAHEMPRWNPISISGYHMREAGCTAIQELAFTLENARTYVREVLKRKLDFDAFAGRLSFFFEAWSDLFEEVAKFRAARRLWAHIAREEFGAKNPRSELLRFHTQTAGASLTAQQPLNNIVRTTMQALAAVLGGTQSLHTNSFDEALALPTEQSATVALRTQQILAHECGITQTVDPLAGSYFVEHLTARLEVGVRQYFAEVDKRGGMLAAIEAGWVAREIHHAAYAYQQKVESGDAVVVGVNRYVADEKARVELQKINPALESERKAALAAHRLQRDNKSCESARQALAEAATGSTNLMPLIIDCVRAAATVGEIADTLRSVWGTHRADRDI